MSIFKAVSSNGDVRYFPHDFIAQDWCGEEAAHGCVAGYDDSCCYEQAVAAHQALADFAMREGMCVAPVPGWISGYLESNEWAMSVALDHYRGGVAILTLDVFTGHTEIRVIHR